MVRRQGFSDGVLFFCSATLALTGLCVATAGHAMIGVIPVVLSVGCYAYGIRSSLRMKKRSADHYMAVKEITYRLDAVGLQVSDSHTDVRFIWNHFDKAIETRNSFALLHGPLTVMLPKRAFDESGIGALRMVIVAHMPITTDNLDDKAGPRS